MTRIAETEFVRWWCGQENTEWLQVWEGYHWVRVVAVQEYLRQRPRQ